MSLRTAQRAHASARRPRRALLVACVAGGALAVPLTGGASSAATTVGMSALLPAQDATSPGEPDAVALLERAWARSRTGLYHGVELVMVDHVTHTVGVSHVSGHTYLYSAAVGAARQAYETADPAAAASSANPLSKDPLALLTQHYTLTVARTDTMLGRDAVVIAAAGQDGRLAAEFWVDRTTSLLVRRDTYDARGNTYSRVAYTSLEVGAPDPALASVTSTPLQPDGTEQDPGALDQLRARGWWAQPTLAGGLTLYDARELVSDGRPLLHLSYSDGISTVSVFEQHGRLAGSARALPAGWRSVVMPGGRTVVQADGTPVRAAWQAHDLVMAVVADGPPAAVTAVVVALPSGPAPAAHGRVMGRLGRGLHRIGTMLNPFG